MDPAWIDARGIASGGRDCLASMGIYLFNRDVLVDAARRRPTITTSARRSFPPPSARRSVQVHLFDGYWEDIGTIRSFYEANLQLAQPNPPFDLTDADGADLHAAAVPAAVADRRRDDQQQPDRRRLHDRAGRDDREQRDRPALPHRPRRDDPQLGDHGRRLLRNARALAASDRRRCRRSASATAASSKGRSSTRTVASARGVQIINHAQRRGRPACGEHCDDPRRHPGRRQGGRRCRPTGTSEAARSRPTGANPHNRACRRLPFARSRAAAADWPIRRRACHTEGFTDQPLAVNAPRACPAHTTHETDLLRESRSILPFAFAVSACSSTSRPASQRAAWPSRPAERRQSRRSTSTSRRRRRSRRS